MKVLLCIGVILLASCPFADGRGEFKIVTNYTAPGDDLDWDNAFGIEAQMIYWANPVVGIASSLGLGRWNVKEQYGEIYYPSYNVLAAIRVKGNATIIPIGLTAILKPNIPGNVGLIFEAGFRYVAVKSAVDASILMTDGVTSVFLNDRFDLGDNVLGTIGGGLCFKPTKTTNLYFGIGYQFDVSKGSIAVFGENSDEENELKGFSIKVGLGFPF